MPSKDNPKGLGLGNHPGLIRFVARVGKAMGENTLEHAETWRQATLSDPEVGRGNLSANVQSARTVIDAYGTPELRSMLKTTGLGNHPEVVRILSRVGKALAENGNHPGRGPSTTSLAQKFYPGMNP